MYRNSAAKQLNPTPGFLSPGYSVSSRVVQYVLPPGEILKSGVVITF